MRIYVVGAGAVGGYFGGRLAAAGEDVTFVCRGHTKAAIDGGGLRLDSVSGNVHVRPATVERPDGTAKADLILWAVKAYSNGQVMPLVEPLISADTNILSLQNGIDAAEELSAAFGSDKVIGGCASIAAEAVEPGVIRHTALGRITLGELNGKLSDRVRKIDSLFDKASIPHRVSDRIRSDLWAKLVWNAAFNPCSVFLHATVEELLNNLSALSILKRAMQETIYVARAEGFDLSTNLIEAYLDPKEQSGEFRTSMLQDFLRKRPLEADAISGAVVRMGRARQIAVPVNELFFDALLYLNQEI